MNYPRTFKNKIQLYQLAWLSSAPAVGMSITDHWSRTRLIVNEMLFLRRSDWTEVFQLCYQLLNDNNNVYEWKYSESMRQVRHTPGIQSVVHDLSARHIRVRSRIRWGLSCCAQSRIYPQLSSLLQANTIRYCVSIFGIRIETSSDRPSWDVDIFIHGMIGQRNKCPIGRTFLCERNRLNHHHHVIILVYRHLLIPIDPFLLLVMIYFPVFSVFVNAGYMAIALGSSTSSRSNRWR